LVHERPSLAQGVPELQAAEPSQVPQEAVAPSLQVSPTRADQLVWAVARHSWQSFASLCSSTT
jgi:hypothetical protein